MSVKITKVEVLRCGAGFRDFCFVKMSTDGKISGPEPKLIVGWSEFLEERNFGVANCIQWMGELVIGKDPMPCKMIYPPYGLSAAIYIPCSILRLSLYI